MEAEFCGEGINSRAFSNSFSMNYLGKNLFPDNIPIQGESTPKKSLPQLLQNRENWIIELEVRLL